MGRVADIFSGVKALHELRFIGQGKGSESFMKYTWEKGLQSFVVHAFAHPAAMPGILESLDYLIIFSRENPIKDFSNLMCEALWAGLQVVTDDDVNVDEYRRFVKIGSESQIVTVGSKNLEETRKRISGLIDGWTGSRRYMNEILYDYSRYIDENALIYCNI